MFGMGWRRLTKQEAMINLHDGKAFQGILYRKSGDLLTMKNVTLYDPESTDPISIDGDVIIDRFDISFIQMIRG